MIKDSEYQALLNKYNIAIAQNRDLRDQLETKNRQHEEYEAKCDVVDGHARKLCEAILAKDRSEMTLGDAKTWHSFTTDEMIAKAMAAFVRYCQQRTELLNQVMEVAERRGYELESLKDQISQMMRTGNTAQLASVEEMMSNAEKEKTAKSAIASAPLSTQKAIAEGRVEAIIEEPGDYDEAEMAAIEHMLTTNNQAKLTPGAPVVSRTPQKSDLIKKKNKAIAAQVIDYEAVVSQLSETAMMIIYIIGHYGLSKTKDIGEQFERDTKKSSRVMDGEWTTLMAAQLITKESIRVPSGHFATYRLSPTGAVVFESRFGEKPVESEVEALIREHGTATHGYGIQALKEILEKDKKYIKVESCPRSSPLKVTIFDGSEKEYIPDLMATTKKYVEYFEYERDTHTQAEINDKCNKMCAVTKFINFVVPELSAAKSLKQKVDNWIQARNVMSLKGITVRIGTIRSLDKESNRWVFVYNLSEGSTPIIDSTSKQ